jgi:hypothetical protein
MERNGRDRRAPQQILKELAHEIIIEKNNGTGTGGMKW